jgi:hypothetical protein
MGCERLLLLKPGEAAMSRQSFRVVSAMLSNPIKPIRAIFTADMHCHRTFSRAWTTHKEARSLMHVGIERRKLGRLGRLDRLSDVSVKWPYGSRRWLRLNMHVRGIAKARGSQPLRRRPRKSTAHEQRGAKTAVRRLCAGWGSCGLVKPGSRYDRH